MFCPRCRRHWQQEEPPLQLPSGKRSSRNCPVCHTLLASDRLATEFPANHEPAVPSVLTVQDVLREASSHSAVGSQTPLDEQMKRFRKSIWEHHDDSHPGLPVTNRRSWHRGTPALHLALGFGSLLAIVMLVVGVFVHTIWQGGSERHPEALPLSGIGQPSALPAAVPVKSQGPVAIPLGHLRKVKGRTQATPHASVSGPKAGVWRLWKTGDGLTTRGLFELASPAGRAALADLLRRPQKPGGKALAYVASPDRAGHRRPIASSAFPPTTARIPG